MTHTYDALFLVTAAALLGPWLSVRLFRGFVPAVVMEIVLGFLIGPHAFKIASNTTYIAFLAAFGFSYLMFLSGLELDFELIFDRAKGQKQAAWMRGAMFFTITLLISLALSGVLYAFGLVHNLVLVSLVLSATSIGIVTPALKDKGWIRSRFGQEILVYALIADLLTLTVFATYITFHSTGNAFSFMLLLALLLIFVILYRLLKLATRFPFFRIVEGATSEFGLRAAFALILLFLAISQTLGTEVVVGAFLAGAIISLLSDRHSVLSHKLNSIGYGFFLPIFFVNVGMNFDLQTLTGKLGFWVMLGVMLVCMYFNTLFPAFLFLKQYPFRARLGGGVLLASRLSLSIAASQIGEQQGLLTPTMANGFILLAIISCLISPIGFNRAMSGVRFPDMSQNEQGPDTLTIDADTLPPGWAVDQIEVQSLRVHERTLKSLHLPEELLFISIIRGDERMVPRGHTELEQSDVLQVMGEPESLEKIRRLFQS